MKFISSYPAMCNILNKNVYSLKGQDLTVHKKDDVRNIDVYILILIAVLLDR